MNDWNTNASALLPGARRNPVGTPSGVVDTPSAKFGTNIAGNSPGEMPADGAKPLPSPKETK
jgi:hypothetical protein